MNALIIQISDIHYRSGRNAATDRMAMLPPAVQNITPDISSVIVIASGDIGYSGQAEEYEIARADFTNLLSELRKRFEKAVVHFIAIPGNHDCDFTDPGLRTRTLLLEGLARNGEPAPDETTLNLCCCVHRNFFAFLKDMQTIEPKVDRLGIYYQYLVPVGSGEILIACFNTAFASSRKENPGHLVYPLTVVDKSQIQPAPLYTIAVFHHPYNWLTPETKRQFSSLIEESADLILTGHEHATAYYKKEAFSGTATDYIEGAVFQEHSIDSECGFNAIAINLSVAQEKVIEYKWNTDHFQSHDQTSGWRPYRRSKSRRDFDLTDTMEKRLADPGAAFSHPAKPTLSLDDIFVAPDADELTLRDGLKTKLLKTRMVEGRKLISTIAERKRVLITGPERCGKSTLAKVIFRHFYASGFLPVMIEGDRLKGDHATDEQLEKFSAMVHARLSQDYKNPLLDKFDQLPAEKVVVIIDDFDEARLNGKGRLRLLQHLLKRYHYIVILGDDLIRLEELTYSDLGAKVLNDYAQFELREYGHVLRSAIIDKWYDVNRDYATNPELLGQKVSRAERVIDDIMRRSYLPSYPIFILTILQGLDLSQPINNAAGSYGYLYQVLITERLAKTALEFSLDKKLGYLTEFAYFMFKRAQRELSQVDFQIFHSQYCKEYTSVDREKMFSALEEASILEMYDKHYRFKYSYFYYYFVAQYFARNLEDEAVRASIVELCNHLEKEEYANIWLFLTHQSRSEFLLDTITSHAMRFFAEAKAPAFEEDVKFLTDLYDKVPALVFVNRSPEQSREQRRKHLDESEEAGAKRKADEADEENDLVRFVVSLRAAIRTLEVTGQIVKNFAGSLKTNPRYTLVRECYELALRVVGVIFEHWQRTGEAFVREVLEVVLQKDTKMQEPKELEKTVKAAIFFFCERIAVAMLKRASQAVGTQELGETYQLVLEKNPTNAYRLIDLGVKLDDSSFPTGDVYDLTSKFKDNVFCHRLLCHLVIDHFYLFSTSDKEKQKVCEKLGIKMQDLRGIDVRSGPQKRLRD